MEATLWKAAMEETGETNIVDKSVPITKPWGTSVVQCKIDVFELAKLEIFGRIGEERDPV